MSHGASHHMGTTRMHDDPKRGVVDATCRIHGMANLYVAGSSVFPTGGFANPTLTIVALAIRLQIISRRSDRTRLKRVTNRISRTSTRTPTPEMYIFLAGNYHRSRHQGVIRIGSVNRGRVITGVSGGIGRALAIGFSRDGTKVVGIARNEQKLHETANACPNGMMDPIVGDVGSEEDVDRLFSHSLDRYGKVDVLINNAAQTPKGMLLEQSPREWFEVLQINLLGALLCSHKALPPMMERGYGRIINLSALRGSWCRPGKFRLFGLQGRGHEPDQGPSRRDRYTFISKYNSKRTCSGERQDRDVHHR